MIVGNEIKHCARSDLYATAKDTTNNKSIKQKKKKKSYSQYYEFVR
jgi:hypothetical protein